MPIDKILENGFGLKTAEVEALKQQFFERYSQFLPEEFIDKILQKISSEQKAIDDFIKNLEEKFSDSKKQLPSQESVGLQSGDLALNIQELENLSKLEKLKNALSSSLIKNNADKSEIIFAEFNEQIEQFQQYLEQKKDELFLAIFPKETALGALNQQVAESNSEAKKSRIFQAISDVFEQEEMSSQSSSGLRNNFSSRKEISTLERDLITVKAFEDLISRNQLSYRDEDRAISSIKQKFQELMESGSSLDQNSRNFDDFLEFSSTNFTSELEEIAEGNEGEKDSTLLSNLLRFAQTAVQGLTSEAKQAKEDLVNLGMVLRKLSSQNSGKISQKETAQAIKFMIEAGLFASEAFKTFSSLTQSTSSSLATRTDSPSTAISLVNPKEKDFANRNQLLEAALKEISIKLSGEDKIVMLSDPKEVVFDIKIDPKSATQNGQKLLYMNAKDAFEACMERRSFNDYGPDSNLKNLGAIVSFDSAEKPLSLLLIDSPSAKIKLSNQSIEIPLQLPQNGEKIDLGEYISRAAISNAYSRTSSVIASQNNDQRQLNSDSTTTFMGTPTPVSSAVGTTSTSHSNSDGDNGDISKLFIFPKSGGEVLALAVPLALIITASCVGIGKGIQFAYRALTRTGLGATRLLARNENAPQTGIES